MKEYKCIRTCLPFVQGNIYQGRLIVFHVCGTIFESYEMYAHDGEPPIFMPCEKLSNNTASPS